MVKASCADCKFYQDGVNNNGENAFNMGLCRLNPPQQKHHNQHGFWPVVTQRDWCGQFSAR